MTPDEHTHHGGPEPQPGEVLETQTASPERPKPLLKDATASIYFDGLIFMAYNERRRLYQGAVLTEAEGHQTRIDVKVTGQQKPIWPAKDSDWDPDHATVKARAPFWLYVDSGQGIQKEDFSAKLHLPADANDPRSFKEIFNFEEKYDRPIRPKPETFAEFNFPHGVSYSAKNTKAALKTKLPDQPIEEARPKGNFNVSTLAGVDINAASNGDDKKYIVLANEEGKNEFFRFELKPGTHYEISILNVPVGHTSHDPQDHFLQFYELFDLKQGEPEFLVAPVQLPTPPTADSPPCVSTTGGTKGGLGGG